MKEVSIKPREAYRILFQEYPDVVGVEELQAMLGIGRKRAYQLLKDGSILPLTVGRKYRIPKVNIIRYLLTTSS